MFAASCPCYYVQYKSRTSTTHRAICKFNQIHAMSFLNWRYQLDSYEPICLWSVCWGCWKRLRIGHERCLPEIDVISPVRILEHFKGSQSFTEILKIWQVGCTFASFECFLEEGVSWMTCFGKPVLQPLARKQNIAHQCRKLKSQS